MWGVFEGKAGQARDGLSLLEIYLRSLIWLNLASSNVGDGGVRALAESVNVSGLTALDLSKNHVTDHGARLLVHSPYLQRLTWLRLEHNDIREPEITALRKRFEGVVDVRRQW